MGVSIACIDETRSFRGVERVAVGSVDAALVVSNLRFTVADLLLESSVAFRSLHNSKKTTPRKNDLFNSRTS
jgi:hypothetical protein